MGQRIDVNHENIYYGDFLAVEDVNINIEPNKVTSFIGPSGCGKSTVLCAVPTSGKRSRTVLTTLASACPVASSSVCASPAPWPSTRRCCSWMSPAPPWTRFRPWLSRI